MKINKEKYNFIKRALEIAVNPPYITRQECLKLEKEGFRRRWVTNSKTLAVSRGVYKLPDLPEVEPKK